jgi:predicted dithiol-disulfide oxidoreductase (DUF899 family)
MMDESANRATKAPSLPAAVDRATFQAELDRLRVQEKAPTRWGDAIAAARRRQLIAYYFMWYPGRPAAEQCEGCTWCTTQVDSVDVLLVGRQINLMHLVCYVRDGDRVFETYWTNYRGVEAMDNSLALMDLTVYGRQQTWEDSPPGWPVDDELVRVNGRPPAHWSRLEAGRSDDLGTAHGGR